MQQNWDPRQNSNYGGLLVCKETWVENGRSRNRKMGKLHSAKGPPSCAHRAAPHFVTRVGAEQQNKPIFLVIPRGSNLPLVTTWYHSMLSLARRAAPGWRRGLSITAFLCQCLFQAAGTSLFPPHLKTNVNYLGQKFTAENTISHQPISSGEKKKSGGSVS